MKKETLLFKDWKALGTTWGVFFWCGPGEYDFPKIEKDIQDTIISFEEKFSRFKESSLVSQLNTRGSAPYDRELEEMLLSGDEITKRTEGVFSLFIKKALEEKGYGMITKNPKKGSGATEWEREGELLRLYSEKGLDLGGIGKGVLIDRIAKILQEKYRVESFLINGGGDLYATHGGGAPIKVFLENPLVCGEVIGEVELLNESLCCSSSFKRKWVQNGEEKNHFISGDSREVWAASFVIAQNATLADTFATTLCILTQKPKKLEEIMKRNKDIEFLAVGENGEIYKTKRFNGVL
jgi:thiamine biosynthesis lipoprotein